MKTRKGYLIKRGKTYYAVWTVTGTKFCKTTKQTNKKEALKVLSRLMQPFLVEDEVRTLETVKARIEGAKGELTEIQELANPPLTIVETWSVFKASQNRPRTGKATLGKYEIQWGIFKVWMGNHYPTVRAIRDITPEIAEEFAGWLISKNRSSGTFNKYMNVLSLVFRTVSEKARMTANPWANPAKDGHGKGIRRMEKEIHGRRELTIDELRDVCAAAKDDLRLLLAIGIYSGLRLGDASTLRWGECDLVRGIIIRVPNKTSRKSPNKPVKVPMHPALRAMLAEVPKADRIGYVLPRIATDYLRHSSYVTDRVQSLFSACKIQTTRKIEGRYRAQVEVGFHSLRHSFVSMCSENKVAQSVVQGMIGHSNPAMTRHYDHAEHESDKVAAVALLPSMSREPVQDLPSLDPLDALKAELLAIVREMDKKTWEKSKTALLEKLEA